MTRFLHIADTHLGADPMGFQQQPGYPEKLPVILNALCRQLKAIGGVDFILHGGDMIDATTVSSLVETPFEFKRFEVKDRKITMQTLSLQPHLGFQGEYDGGRHYVQGRPCKSVSVRVLQ